MNLADLHPEPPSTYPQTEREMVVFNRAIDDVLATLTAQMDRVDTALGIVGALDGVVGVVAQLRASRSVLASVRDRIVSLRSTELPF